MFPTGELSLKMRRSAGRSVELLGTELTSYGDSPVAYDADYVRVEQGLTTGDRPSTLIYELLGLGPERRLRSATRVADADGPAGFLR